MPSKILTQAKAYWTISVRYHKHRLNPAMEGVALREMKALTPTSQAVLARVNQFIARHQGGSPSDGGGPRFA